jgi:crotonobetainyl-CoA:carnitine CoA-transferase CaiB-like acyl-CoA transferase
MAAVRACEEADGSVGTSQLDARSICDRVHKRGTDRNANATLQPCDLAHLDLTTRQILWHAHRMAAPLAGVRIIECSMLGPGAITTHLADLGADVIKVEPPSGDYIRQMTWPIVEGVSLMHLHISRGKRSIILDLRTEEGGATFLELVRGADAVIEAMRPGGLERRGLGYDRLRAINPAIVFCTISGYGMTGPYKDMPSHGIAYDVWAGLVQPDIDDDGFCSMPEHPSMGIHAGPLFGALAVLAGIIQARATGEGCQLEVAQSDAAAAMDWLRSETYKAYERPEDEVTGNASDDYERRAPGTGGMRDGVRYQFYATADGHILFMASEREFWENFCRGIGRPELFEQHPGSKYADHARGDTALRAELKAIFAERTTAEWLRFGGDVNTPIAPVNTPKTIADDPQFQDRLPWLSQERLGASQVPSPIKVVGESLPEPTRAPSAGQHSDEVLREVLGYDEARISALREAGALG